MVCEVDMADSIQILVLEDRAVCRVAYILALVYTEVCTQVLVYKGAYIPVRVYTVACTQVRVYMVAYIRVLVGTGACIRAQVCKVVYILALVDKEAYTLVRDDMVASAYMADDILPLVAVAWVLAWACI